MYRPSLSTRNLLLFVAVQDRGSITAGAELLGITQSAASRQLREMERHLGTQLYARTRKRLELTAAGECLLQKARDILAELEQAETDTRQIPAQPRVRVRLGAGAYSAYGWLPALLDRLAAAEPDVDLVLAGAGPTPPQDDLLQGRLDLALAPGPGDRRTVHATPLFEDRLVAILPPGHRLAGRSHLDAADFAGEAFVTHDPTYERGFETDRVLRPAQVWPTRLIKANLTDAIVDLVAAGTGLSVLSRWALEPALAAGRVRAAEVTADGLPVTWHALTRRSEDEGAAARRTARVLADECARHGGLWAEAAVPG